MIEPEIRRLARPDYAILERFLSRHAATSMFLRSNARAAGLEDHGELFHATYIGAFDDAELVGVMCHCWNGMILVQAPDEAVLARLYRALRALPTIADRGITGAAGDYRQVRAIVDALKPDARLVQMDAREGLFALALKNLLIPPLLQQGSVVCRHFEARDMATLLRWRVDYSVEALGARRDAVRQDEEAAMLRRYLENRHGFVLAEARAGRLLATSLFNAALPDAVQIGNVWTPPELRGRGYARAVVAGQLRLAGQDGVREAILFADDAAAIRVYESVGFKKISEYGITLLGEPWFITAVR